MAGQNPDCHPLAGASQHLAGPPLTLPLAGPGQNLVCPLPAAGRGQSPDCPLLAPGCPPCPPARPRELPCRPASGRAGPAPALGAASSSSRSGVPLPPCWRCSPPFVTFVALAWMAQRAGHPAANCTRRASVSLGACSSASKDARLASESNHSRQTLPASASALSRVHRLCSCRMLGARNSRGRSRSRIAVLLGTRPTMSGAGVGKTES